MTNSKTGIKNRYKILVAVLLVYNVWIILHEEFGYRDDWGSEGQWLYIYSCIPFFIAYGITSFLIARNIIIPNLLLFIFEHVTTEIYINLPDTWIVTFISLFFSFVTFLIFKIRAYKNHT